MKTTTTTNNAANTGRRWSIVDESGNIKQFVFNLPNPVKMAPFEAMAEKLHGLAKMYVTSGECRTEIRYIMNQPTDPQTIIL